MKVSEHVQDNEFLKGQHLVDWNLPSAIVTIDRVDFEVFEATQERAADSKFILTFQEVDNRFPLNKTNLRCLTGLFGDETDTWLGQKIVLNAVDVMYQGQTTKGIRVAAIPQETKLPTRALPTQAASATPTARPTPAAIVPTPPTPIDNAIPPDDPFAADDPITQEQFDEIDALCKANGRNIVNTSQRLYALNPDQLSFGQAADFLVKLRAEANKEANRQTVGAVRR